MWHLVSTSRIEQMAQGKETKCVVHQGGMIGSNT